MSYLGSNIPRALFNEAFLNQQQVCRATRFYSWFYDVNVCFNQWQREKYGDDKKMGEIMDMLDERIQIQID